MTEEEIDKFAQERELTYFETSARTKKGIMEGITYMANEIYDKIELENKALENKDTFILKEKGTNKLKKISACLNSKQKK